MLETSRISRTDRPGQGVAAQQAGDRVRGDGREQHPVAVVAGGDQQAVRTERADQRQVVGAPRPQAGGPVTFEITICAPRGTNPSCPPKRTSRRSSPVSEGVTR